jgi:hypothetical protein
MIGPLNFFLPSLVVMPGWPHGGHFFIIYENNIIMDSQYLIRQVDREAWLCLAPVFSDYNYRQAWDFGAACAVRVGATSEHMAIECPGQKIVGLADVRIRKPPLLGGGIAYINGGPLVRNEDLNEDTAFPVVIQALIEEYVIRRKLLLRIAPPIVGDPKKNGLEKALLQMGFTEMPQKKKTIFLDLSQDVISIRKNFHQKWRSRLGKSEKNGLTVRTGQDASVFHDFIPLYNELINEKNFFVDLDVQFYANVQECAADGDKFFIMLAEHEGSTVAGHVSSILGNTCVTLLRAVNNIGRNLNAAYLLHWNTIQLAKAAGCQWYDLGGIDPEGNPGVYEFKSRMGGQEITIPGPYQIKPTGHRAILVPLAEKVYTALKPYLVRS